MRGSRQECAYSFQTTGDSSEFNGVQSLRRRHVRGACRSRTQLTAPPPQLGTLAAKVKPRSGSSYFHVRAESSRSRAFFAKTSDPERASSNTHSQTRRASRSHKGGACFACVCEGRFPRSLVSSQPAREPPSDTHICIVVHWHVAYICARVLRARVHA